MINDETIERICTESDIADVIRRGGVHLAGNGNVLTGCCPFHDDNTPSFKVWRSTGTWKCFGCGEHGNAITFVMKRGNRTFYEAAKELAADLNIEVNERKLTREEKNEYDWRQRLYKANEEAAAFWQHRLDGDARAYALGRWDAETIETFGIGYAPDEWSALFKHLMGKGFTVQEIESAGLCKRNQKGTGYYDIFRNRLMFPIADRLGRIVGFSGRDLSASENSPKYINTGETEIYHKGDELFGFTYATAAIKKYDVCIIVEGNPDVVKMHQIGVRNVVAACGTALTEKQVQAIARYTENICLLYDSDSAGQQATDRSARMITGMGYTAITLEIPSAEDGGKQDPDTYFTSSMQFSMFYNANKCNYIVKVAANKAANCNNDPDYRATAVKEIARMFYTKPANIQKSLIHDLAAFIPNEALWNQTVKELKAEDREKQKADVAKQRTDRQNEMFKLYGFYEKDNCYWFRNPKGDGIICGSNFIMAPLFHIESTINAKRLYRLTNVHGIERVVEFPQKDLISLSAFKLRCESLGNFLFDGGEYGLAKIKMYLYEKTETCKEITQMGWQKEGFWAWSNGIWDNGAFQPITADGICRHDSQNFYIPALSSFYKSDDSLYMFERKFRHNEGNISLYDWLNLFCSVYNDNAIVGFSFYVATLFRDIIVSTTRFFPVLNIFGVKGSGKSEMAVSITRLFGDLPVGLNMTNSTIAAMADHVAQTKNAVCHIDEYKNSIEYDKVEFLKGLWDGTGRNRMNMDKDKKKEMTAVDCGIVLTGQEMPKADIALFSRVIFTAFSKSTFTEDEKKTFDDLKHIEKNGLTHITNELLSCRNSFAEKYVANYSKASSDLERFAEKNAIEDRIWRNWCVILAALRTIEPKVRLPFSYEKAVETMAQMIITQNAETLKDNEVNTFWDIFAFLVKDGSIEDEYDYRLEHVTRLKTNKVNIERRLTVLVMDRTRVLQLYNKHCKSSGMKALPLSTLKFYLQNSTEYLGEKVYKMKQRTDRLINGVSTKGNDDCWSENTVLTRTISSRCDCFNFDALNIDIEQQYTAAQENDHF